MKVLTVLFLFQCAASGVDIPTNTPPSVATNFFRLLPSFLSTNYGTDGSGWRTVGQAHVQVTKLGTSVLPLLVAEMNKTNYISDLVGVNKLADQRWIMRMRLAEAVESISGEDFKCKTSVHGWTPDYSFNAINNWWTNKVFRR
jgi:hypothetical protein